jgi:hypothetical protein
MNSNVKIHTLLGSWLYNDIIKIILSYRTLDHEKLIFVKKIDDIKCSNIIVIGNKMYLNHDFLSIYSNEPAYYDLLSEKLFTDTIKISIKMSDKYIIYNKMTNNIIFGDVVRFFYEKNWSLDLHADKVKIYKKYIFFSKYNIFYEDLENMSGWQLFYHPANNIKYNIDFDIFDDYIYIYDGNFKISMCNILDKKFKFESEETSDIRNFVEESIDLHYVRIFVTKNYVFLYSILYILIFFRDLKFFRKIDLPLNKFCRNSNGFFVQDNIIYLVNNHCINIYQLC